MRLNRLARTAGAPIDKGAGIKVFKKIGDRVEKGEPLYRIYAYDAPELDLAVAAAPPTLAMLSTSARTTSSRRRDRGHCPVATRWCSGRGPAGGATGPRPTCNRCAPLSRWRVARHRWAGADTTILYVPLDRPNDKLLAILFAAEALRRGGAKRLVLVAPYLCYMRQDAAFHKGEAISQRAVGRLLAGIVDRVVTVDAHLHRTVHIGDVFPGIEADDLSAIPAVADFVRTGGFRPTPSCRPGRRIDAVGRRSRRSLAA